MTEPRRHHLVGRLELDVPAAFQRMPQEARILGSAIEESDLPAGVTQDAAAEALWKERLAAAKAGETGDHPFEFVRNEVLGSGVRVMELKERVPEQKKSYLPEKHVLEALVVGQGRAVVIQRRWMGDSPEAPDTPELREHRENAIGSFHHLIGGVRFLSGSASPVDRAWYYLGGAALAVSHERVAAEEEENESTLVVFQDEPRGMQMELKTEYPWFPDSEGEPGLISGFAKTLMESWSGVDVIRSERRSVAGMKGEEVIGQEEKRREINFTWARNREKSGTQYRPRLRIDMRARAEDRELAMAIWDAVLDSIRLLPRG